MTDGDKSTDPDALRVCDCRLKPARCDLTLLGKQCYGKLFFLRPAPGSSDAESTRAMEKFLRDVITGRHDFFSCYEAFIHIIDSMLNQHAKWLKVCRKIGWRGPVASLNYLLSNHVWRQDHNGFSHQDPRFIDHVVNKKAAITVYALSAILNWLMSFDFLK